MDWNVLFLVNSVMLGIGLAMDAFAVSMANGLHEPKMRLAKMSGVAGVFAFFSGVDAYDGMGLCSYDSVLGEL